MIIFLHGPDTFRSRKKLAELKVKFKKDVDASGINLVSLDGMRASYAEIENAVLSVPFLARKRMVALEKILVSKKHEKNLEKILALVQKKSASDTIIIFWEEELDVKKLKKNPLGSALLKEKYIYFFKNLLGAELNVWIQKHARELGGTIDSSAAEGLAQNHSENPWMIHHELEKLISYKKGAAITLKDIREFSPQSFEENIFALTDALGHKKKKEAMMLVRNFLQLGTTLGEIVYRCLWQCKNLILVKSILDKEGSLPSYSLAQKTGIHPFVVKKCLTQSLLFTLPGLKKMHTELLEIDAKIKTGQKTPEALLDLLFVES